MKIFFYTTGLVFVLSFFASRTFALGQLQYVETTPGRGSFSIVQKNCAAALWIDGGDWAGVIRAGGDLQADIQRVTGSAPEIFTTGKVHGTNVILVGTLGKSALIDRLIREKKINVSEIAGKWESFLIQVVPDPWPGVATALVICGSDKRGTIYGVYDLSEQMGVSPWHYWADVSARHRDSVFVKAGKCVQGPPSVKYRGIFLNDEAPDLTRWIQEKYGSAPGFSGAANYGPGFYTNVFELILRLKGNYLWPAMWNNAFNEDNTNNAALADEYGIVMGTSHQEPMLRAQKEWDRRFQKTLGSWNYAKHPDVVENFWREGVMRNKNYESIITLGLRGANDTPMADGGPEANMALLQKIVGVQRKMISEEVNFNLVAVPQLWCLYKEVMDFYNAGMRAPDDVTLLWAEDNWGNVRRLPTAEERKRSGGAGVYYHFDYHGGPRSYQWLNTSPIAKIWDQMSLAKQYGADRIWIVNVGHFKGYEFPLEFFMSLAWNSDRWRNDDLGEFTRLWAMREFGPEYAGDIADIISKYTKYNGRRKPELLDATAYSLVNYQEAENIVADFKTITTRAEKISAKLPVSERAAFYELVLFPTKASALLNEMYLAAAKNALYARQGRASANDWAAQTRSLFAAETNLTDEFNRAFLGGKWNHFMDQAVIGYKGWADPPQNNLDAIPLAEIVVPDAATMGVGVEGSESAWPGASGKPALPQFDSINQQWHYIDVFNKGKTSFTFSATASAPWIVLSATNGTIKKEERLWVSVNWAIAPKGVTSGAVTLMSGTNGVSIALDVFNSGEVTRNSLRGFVEGGGVVSIEPEHFTKKTDAGENQWIKIEDYGRTLSGMRATGPVDASSATPGKDSPCLQYEIYLFNVKTVEVAAVTSPVLNFMPDRGIRYAVSFDDEPPQIITLVPKNYRAQNGNADWETAVQNNCRVGKSKHSLDQAGYHTLKLWMVEPGVVLQKIVVNTGGVKPSYLGPPESFFR